MNILYTIFFVIFIIRLIAYFLKNSENPNRNNTIVKEYNFLEKSPKIETVEKVKKSEREELNQFAKHHFKELKKINPLINLNDDFPEALFPKAFKKLLLTDNATDEDYIEAIKSINTNFTRPVGEEYKKNEYQLLEMMYI